MFCWANAQRLRHSFIKAHRANVPKNKWQFVWLDYHVGGALRVSLALLMLNTLLV